MNYLTIRLSVHHPFEASSPSLVDSTTLPVSVNKKHSSRCRRCFQSPDPTPDTPNLPTNIVDFGGSDSSVILIQRGGILMSKRDFPESLSQAMLVGTMLVGRLGVKGSPWIPRPGTPSLLNIWGTNMGFCEMGVCKSSVLEGSAPKTERQSRFP